MYPHPDANTKASPKKNLATIYFEVKNLTSGARQQDPPTTPYFTNQTPRSRLAFFYGGSRQFPSEEVDGWVPSEKQPILVQGAGCWVLGACVRTVAHFTVQSSVRLLDAVYVDVLAPPSTNPTVLRTLREGGEWWPAPRWLHAELTTLDWTERRRSQRRS